MIATDMIVYITNGEATGRRSDCVLTPMQEGLFVRQIAVARESERAEFGSILERKRVRFTEEVPDIDSG